MMCASAAPHRQKVPEIGDCPPYSQSSGGGRWQGCRRGGSQTLLQKRRPVRGDNRTGQAIWALGVDGRSRRIQPRWGGITAPTSIGRGGSARRSTGYRSFLTLWQVCFCKGFWQATYCAAYRLASAGADFSDAMAATAGGLKALVAGAS